jgi:Tfp pilus assembly protein PilP
MSGRRSLHPARCLLIVLPFWLPFGCGSDPPPAPPPAAAPKPAAAATTAAPAAAKPQTAKEKLLQEVHQRPFKQEELTPSENLVTDPFHNNLSRFVEKQDVAKRDECPLFKYNIEELKMSAIITGTDDNMAKAMFVDPTGVGHFLKRGDKVGKQCALVQRVLSDKVVFEFTETISPGKTRSVQRTLELYPGEQNVLLNTLKGQ